METKKVEIGKTVWFDESYTDKEGKRVNPHKGVMYLISHAHLPKGKTEEKVFYIVYRLKDGRMIREKAGREFRDKMTAAKAAVIRDRRIKGDELPNKDRRKAQKAKRDDERTKAKAEKAAAAEKPTFAHLFTLYLASKGVYPRKAGDELRFEKYLREPIGKKVPEELSASDLDAIRLKRMKGKAVGTIVTVLELVRRISNFGKKRKLTAGTDFIVELPVDGAERTEQLSDDQTRAYLAEVARCPYPIIGRVLAFTLLTGLRAQEVRGLKWNAVDIQRGMITLKAPKGKKDVSLPLSDAAHAILQDLPQDGEYVFQGETGKGRSGMIGKSSVLRHGRAALRAIGIMDPKWRQSHGLRHSFATALASSGQVELYDIQKLLTHKNPKTTMRYAAIHDAALKRGANVMGRFATPPEVTPQDRDVETEVGNG